MSSYNEKFINRKRKIDYIEELCSSNDNVESILEILNNILHEEDDEEIIRKINEKIDFIDNLNSIAIQKKIDLINQICSTYNDCKEIECKKLVINFLNNIKNNETNTDILNLVQSKLEKVH
jgi:hypothetical protein